MDNNPSNDEDNLTMPNIQNTRETRTSHVNRPPIDNLERTHQFSYQPQLNNVSLADARASLGFGSSHYQTGSLIFPDAAYPNLLPGACPIPNYYNDYLYHNATTTNGWTQSPYELPSQLHPYQHNGMAFDPFQRNLDYLTHHHMLRSYYNNLQQATRLTPTYDSDPVSSSSGLWDSSIYSTNDCVGFIPDSTTTTVPIEPRNLITPAASDDANGWRKTGNNFRSPKSAFTSISTTASNDLAAKISSEKQPGCSLSIPKTPVDTSALASSSLSTAAKKMVAIIPPCTRVSPYDTTNSRKSTLRSAAQQKRSSTRKSVADKKSTSSKSSVTQQRHPRNSADGELTSGSSQTHTENLSNDPIGPAANISVKDSSKMSSNNNQFTSEPAPPSISFDQNTSGLHSSNNHLHSRYNPNIMPNSTACSYGTTTPTAADLQSSISRRFVDHMWSITHAMYAPSPSNWTDILNTGITPNRSNSNKTVEMTEQNMEIPAQSHSSATIDLTGEN